ncbi:MAG: dihydrodipicolinate synthase family protein [Acidobacteria bacterium]|nr:dihydrodipicolinate synthase family protein [Acidobacteriota bacterium]MCI0623010.1 dihydrodipicolinate synthase family protein [Acidobacteriota bacterium]MCI0717482.1 dihydrodipicolinate synthase family protein [Acidobacteriota bacterium]
MRKQLPPRGLRVILATLWTPPTEEHPFGEMDTEAMAAQARRLYDSGHRVFITTAGSGSGFDIALRQVIVAARSLSEALSDKEDAWIYVGCVAGLEQCLEVSNAVRDLKNVKGLLILPNRHPHGDPKGDGWLEFYQMLSPAMQFPYMIYHVQAGLTVEQYVELAEDPCFVELKWALATQEALDLLRQAVKALAGSVSVVCGLGDKNGPDWIAEYGVRGWTSYTVNQAPCLCKEIERASLRGDTARVQALQGPVLAFEEQRFDDNVRFNNRLVVAALQGREAFLRPPNRRYDDAEWRDAERVITRLAAAEAEAKVRSNAALNGRESPATDRGTTNTAVERSA